MSNREPWILGLSSAFHNGAACLLHGDQLVVAIQEERLTRIKRDKLRVSEQPLAIEYCLAAADISPQHLDMIVDCTISWSPQSTDLLEHSPIVQSARADVALASIPHHLGHAYSAYATSGFDESAVLIIDGGGSFSWQLTADERDAVLGSDDGMCEHASVYYFTKESVRCVEKHMAHIPYIYDPPKWMYPFATIGHMYASVSKQIFGDYLEAGKVMGLAPYGSPTTPVGDFLEFDGDGFIFHDHVPERFAHSERWPKRKLEYQDLAASTQCALEYALDNIVSKVESEKLSRNLCYAGGVALNSVANHKILRSYSFEDIHIMPAAEDSGPAIGAAYFGLSQLGGLNRSRRLRTDFPGRTYDSEEISDALTRTPRVKRLKSDDLVEATAKLLESGEIVGWFDGGSEFGPRALGHRSILCDPRREDAKEILNSRVKHREKFRPFAPIILAEHVTEWFETDKHYRAMDFMLDVCAFNPSVIDQVPGVVHVDGTGRLQTVAAADNPKLHALLQAFRRRTGVPMLINTSFNVMGEPLVETPLDALLCFLTTGIQYCCLDDHLICKDAPSASILDLTPVINAHVRLNAAGARTIGVDTPHGKWIYKDLSQPLLELIGRINGTSTGWELSRTANQTPQDRTEAESQLITLARYSVIRFVDETL